MLSIGVAARVSLLGFATVMSARTPSRRPASPPAQLRLL